ncbi:AI-2E family transporter [Chroococcus sp. FPU101]|uniref:AI-2E family transporter n=1 Tax=Chroococcus sp. FPU101 TaxID=1974212 RepID=UPI001A8DF015|nr:AI-2E family transporter [Chroococcus sp. FPU101]GFE69382.1 protein of unknown function UPF0118 [Chroococcus sp. FPU101]
MAASNSSTHHSGWLKTRWDTLNFTSRLLILALAAPLIVLNIWALSAIFGYFKSLFVILLTASVFSFLLSYPVDWLEHKGLKRGQAAVLVFFTTLLIVLAVGVILLPLVFTQAQQLVARLPEWLDSGQRQLMKLEQQAETMGLPVHFDGLITQINSQLGNELQNLAGKTLNLALNFTVFTLVKVVDVLLVIFLTLYILLHGQTVWSSLIDWLPRKVQKPFSLTLRLSFQNYFLGQTVSATCMAIGLVSGFVLLKIPFGLLFGLTIGVMALIPFGGTVGIISFTLLVALRDIGAGLQMLAVALVVQQIVENGIAPRILGSVTGLNPFWVLVSLLMGARVGGLLGVIVAIPMAVMIKEALKVIRSAPQGERLFDPDVHTEAEKLPTSEEYQKIVK